MEKQSRRLTIIDDDDGVRGALRVLFQVLEYDVTAHSSAEAYLASEAPIPDCLLIDLELNGMSGVDAVGYLQSAGRLGPTIIMTGSRNTDLLRRARRSAADLVMPKPLDPDQLESEVARLSALTRKVLCE